MTKALFVTGTDTGVGKTWVATTLLHALRAQGKKVVGMKPIASGSERTVQGLRNEDALALQAAANVQAEYELINPYCFEPAIAPHLAAQRAGVNIELSVLMQTYQRLTERADVVVVEGAGGWRVPVADGYFSDFPEALSMDVVLVVGLRLGCLNHAVLTAEAIQRGPCRLLGWVGNHLPEPFNEAPENLATLRQRLSAPCLGVLPYAPGSNPQQWAHELRIPDLAQ
ncbi:MAG: dethiobiotin synthase [Steroidobacteraceae bacterium]